jgi:hypothetical protein
MTRPSAFRKCAIAVALRYAATLALVLMLVPPAGAQPSTAVPENARARAYGGGWNCVYGFREERGACAGVVVPANGHLTARGNDWECNRLFRKVDGACAPLRARLRASATAM